MNSQTAIDGKTWGARVAERRTAIGMTQDQLADLCQLTQQSISRIEKDQITPRDKTKVLIAEKLGTVVNDLFPWPKSAA